MLTFPLTHQDTPNDEMPKTALFVVDTQAGLISIPDTAIPHSARIWEVGNKILDRARNVASTELEIVIVQHSDDAEDPNASLLPGTKEWELSLPMKVGGNNERIVSKTTRDTFKSNPSLADELKSQGITTIVAFGIQSECCVLETCRGAVEAGFTVVLLQGAHSTYDDQATGLRAEQIERQVEQELCAIGVQVVPWEQYVF
ncbi:Isochorismatase-like protein [Aspergillus flavus]|uniref:Isochorismatase-like protein n=1 Tax=Aspergillus flavus (strain ATCC 200026 / FGSC A1120 / IAM 13836 / NRRL 3357 / JCM 12722 / SRRC 167) TaxID=332952 RepID=A0A7U2MGJ8_ASPFN|nr:hypothetical protein AFLA_000210 [Aspergillus flavus NRRL3357]QRD83326.1 Isochorismatase-like protein [Aspergillus flavus]